MTVRSLNAFVTAARSFFSVDESSALVASSSTTTEDCLKVALAMLSSCSCPAEKFSPPSRTSRSSERENKGRLLYYNSTLEIELKKNCN